MVLLFGAGADQPEFLSNHQCIRCICPYDVSVGMSVECLD